MAFSNDCSGIYPLLKVKARYRAHRVEAPLRFEAVDDLASLLCIGRNLCEQSAIHAAFCVDKRLNETPVSRPRQNERPGIRRASLRVKRDLLRFKSSSAPEFSYTPVQRFLNSKNAPLGALLLGVPGSRAWSTTRFTSENEGYRPRSIVTRSARKGDGVRPERRRPLTGALQIVHGPCQLARRRHNSEVPCQTSQGPRTSRSLAASKSPFWAVPSEQKNKNDDLALSIRLGGPFVQSGGPRVILWAAPAFYGQGPLFRQSP